MNCQKIELKVLKAKIDGFDVEASQLSTNSDINDSMQIPSDIKILQEKVQELEILTDRKLTSLQGRQSHLILMQNVSEIKETLYIKVSTIALRKIPSFHLVSWCGNLAERHSFHTRKSGGITVFFVVTNSPNLRNCYFRRKQEKAKLKLIGLKDWNFYPFKRQPHLLFVSLAQNILDFINPLSVNPTE